MIKISFTAGIALAISGFGSSAMAKDGDSSALQGVEFRPSVELIGGLYMNEHLQSGVAGREHQIKMTRAVLSLELSRGDWQSRIELVGLGDEMKHVEGDRAYLDIYRNLGTDLYYYGDHPVREAWIGQKKGWGYWKAGRMTTLMSEPVTSDRFASASEAPHAVIMNTGLLNGFQAGWETSDRFVVLEGAVMGGRDRPCLGANCYLDGKLDVNEKGNNTPVLEAKATLRPMDQIEVYAGYHYNKVGSAVGTFNSGKHNDNRVTVGAKATLLDHELLNLGLSGEFNRFTVGLTTEGSQGEETVVESRDIDQNGYYVMLDATLPQYDLTLRYTHETMDRMDAAAWQEVAAFNPEHPVVGSEESRNILSLIKNFDSGFSVRAFYRQDDVPYLTKGDEELEDRAGIVFSYRTSL